MRNSLWLGCLATLGLTAGLAGAAHGESLTIASWGGIVDEANEAAYWKPFEEKTGIEVHSDSFNGELGKIRAQVESGNLQWDMAEPEDAEETLGCLEGLYEPIDKSMLPMDQLPEGAVTDCGVRSLAAGTVLAYDPDAFKDGKGPQSWADFFDPEKFPGKRGVNRHVTDTLVFALLADGVPRDQVYEVLGTKEGQDQAFKMLDRIKDDIVWWSSGTEQIQGLLGGDYDMTVAWNGRIAGANQSEGKNFQMIWDAGYVMGGNLWVILKGTKNYDAAMKFLAFATQPEPQAEFMRHINYGSANTKAYDLISEERRQYMPGTKERLQYAVNMNGPFWVEHLDSLTERFNRWIAE